MLIMTALLALACAFFAVTTAQQYGLPLPERVVVPAPVYSPPVPLAPYAPPPVVPVRRVEVPLKVYGAPARVEGPVSLRENSKIDIRDKSGQYSHGFNAGGTKVSEQGELITTNGGWEYVIAKKGSYSYTSPEGQKISVHYVADHNGFRIVDNPDSV